MAVMTKPTQELDSFILALNHHLVEMRQEHGGELPEAEDIASALNHLEFHTFRGRYWNAITVRKYLSSRAYNENKGKADEQ
jgi:hypothetical protein